MDSLTSALSKYGCQQEVDKHERNVIKVIQGDTRVQHSASKCLVEVSLFASQKRNFTTFNLLSVYSVAMSVDYVAYKSFLGNWFKLEGQSKLSSDHKRPVLVTITSVKTRLSCDINFVMKCFRRRPRPLWALFGVFIQINTLLKPHIGHALLDLRLFWSKKFRKFSRVYKRKRHFLLFCFVLFCFL